MDTTKEKGINFDYILALSDNEGTLSMNKIEIYRHESLIDEIISMLNDSSYHVVDMFKSAKRYLRNYGQVFPLCLGHNYFDSYIDDISFPEIDEVKYSRIIDNARKNIENALKNGYYRYAQKLENKLNKDIIYYKKQYLDKILPFIYSHDYIETLKTNKIKEKYKIFSSELHGRFSYDTDVNEDLKITTRTNFCYGRSSYFHIIVKYKDIEILPYSEWVKYYYAGFNSIMRYTRSYHCNRESWRHSMEFLLDYVNNAIKDPDSFVKNEVMAEVNGLLSGLEEIFQFNDSTFQQRLEVKHIDEDDARYIGISSARHANDRERENYRIKPSECAMIFRMEKVSGALYFLKSLKNLSTIYSEVRSVIIRILELNEMIYPEIIDAIPPIEMEITNLNTELRPIKREYEYKDMRLDKIKERLKKTLEKTEFSKKDEVEANFKKLNPQFERLELDVQELRKKIWEYEAIVDKRKRVLSRLQSFRTLINTTINVKEISSQNS